GFVTSGREPAACPEVPGRSGSDARSTSSGLVETREPIRGGPSDPTKRATHAWTSLAFASRTGRSVPAPPSSFVAELPAVPLSGALLVPVPRGAAAGAAAPAGADGAIPGSPTLSS